MTESSVIRDSASGVFRDSTGAISSFPSSGEEWKQQCRLATAVALATNVYANGSSGVGATLTGTAFGALSIDGVTPAVNDRVLVKNEVAPANNGIYTVTVVGAIATLYVLTRATDYDQAAEVVAGTATFVTAGTANADTAWVQTTTGTITMGSTSLVFAQFGGGAPSGSAGGDLGSTYPNPTVAAIHETTGPTKLTIGSISDGDYLVRSGSTLIGGSPTPSGPPTGAAGGDLSGTYPNPAVAKVNGTSIPATPATGQVPRATGTTAATWQYPPGHQLDYVLTTTDLTVTATTAATAQAFLTGNAVTYDGATRVELEWWAPAVSGIGIVIAELYDGSTDTGLRIGQGGQGNANGWQGPMYGAYFFTPSAASHTYSIKLWRATANMTVNAGGGGIFPGAWLRVTVA